MWDIPENFKVKIGGNYYINCKTLVEVDGESLFTVKRRTDGQLLIDFDIYDEKGAKVATVRNASLVSGDKANYDFKKEVDHYTVTTKDGRTLCDLRRKAKSPDAELEVSVDLYTKTGFRLQATPTHTNAGGGMFVDNVFHNVGAAIVFKTKAR